MTCCEVYVTKGENIGRHETLSGSVRHWTKRYGGMKPTRDGTKGFVLNLVRNVCLRYFASERENMGNLQRLSIKLSKD